MFIYKILISFPYVDKTNSDFSKLLAITENVTNTIDINGIKLPVVGKQEKVRIAVVLF